MHFVNQTAPRLYNNRAYRETRHNDERKNERSHGKLERIAKKLGESRTYREHSRSTVVDGEVDRRHGEFTM